MTENGTTNQDHHQPQCLDPPSFRLPQDWDESRYELWSVRVPVGLNVEMLDGQTLEIPRGNEQPGATVGSFDHDDSHYALVSGHAVENEAFRILQPNEINDDDSDDESNDHNSSMMVPSRVKFSRHVNVVDGSSVQEVADAELAPRPEVAPTPKETIRRAYAPIPQKSGLKRRWMPPGIASHTEMSSTITTASAAATSSAATATQHEDDMANAEPPQKKKRKDNLPTPHEQTSKLNNAEVLSNNKVAETSLKEKSKKEKKAERKAQRIAERKAKKEKKKEKKARRAKK